MALTEFPTVDEMHGLGILGQALQAIWERLNSDDLFSVAEVVPVYTQVSTTSVPTPQSSAPSSLDTATEDDLRGMLIAWGYVPAEVETASRDVLLATVMEEKKSQPADTDDATDLDQMTLKQLRDVADIRGVPRATYVGMSQRELLTYLNNNTTPAPSETDGTYSEVELSKMSKMELVEVAKVLGLTKVAAMKKDDIIINILGAQEAT